jgi:ribosome-associated protein
MINATGKRNLVAFFSILVFFSKIKERWWIFLSKEIQITTDYITLGQFLKLADVISTGGMAKWFLSEHQIFVNGESENRRGKKLFKDDVVEIPEFGTFVIKS